VYIYAPYLVYYDLFPGPEHILELCEEVLDINCCANHLKCELSDLPASEPESDLAFPSQVVAQILASKPFLSTDMFQNLLGLESNLEINH